MSAFVPLTPKPVNLFLNENPVRESCDDCGKFSAKEDEMPLAYVVAEGQGRAQAHPSVACWNALHDVQGSFADAHSLL